QPLPLGRNRTAQPALPTAACHRCAAKSRTSAQSSGDEHRCRDWRAVAGSREGRPSDRPASSLRLAACHHALQYVSKPSAASGRSLFSTWLGSLCEFFMHEINCSTGDIAGVADLPVPDPENGRNVTLGAFCNGLVGQARGQQRIQFFRKIGSAHGCLLCSYAHNHAPVHICQRCTLLPYALPKATIARMHKSIDKILAELMRRDGL
nr:hypothetical protein [Tanacetum cinerariifolium]